MTLSNSHVLNCRVNAPGLWPLTISLGAPLSAFSSCSGQTVTTEIRTRADNVAPKSGRLSPVLRGLFTTGLAGSVSRFLRCLIGIHRDIPSTHTNGDKCVDCGRETWGWGS